jgi:hypothetical protein
MELRCAYCGDAVDPTTSYWVLERWENGRAVARGAVSNTGCLIATAHAQRPREPGITPLRKGVLDRVE